MCNFDKWVKEWEIIIYFTVEDMNLDDKFSLKTNNTPWNKYPIIMKFKDLVVTEQFFCREKNDCAYEKFLGNIKFCLLKTIYSFRILFCIF